MGVTDRRPVAIGLGEILWDLLPTGKCLGGAPANFAYHANQLGCRGIAVTAIGDDENGREIEAQLASLGLSQCSKVSRPTAKDCDAIAIRPAR